MKNPTGATIHAGATQKSSPYLGSPNLSVCSNRRRQKKHWRIKHTNDKATRIPKAVQPLSGFSVTTFTMKAHATPMSAFTTVLHTKGTSSTATMGSQVCSGRLLRKSNYVIRGQTPIICLTGHVLL